MAAALTRERTGDIREDGRETISTIGMGDAVLAELAHLA